MLSKGLDSGLMLYHALPKLDNDNPFKFTMRASEAAQQSLVERIGNKQIKEYKPQEQDKKSEIRYTKNADFTDEVTANFLSKNIDNIILKDLLKNTLKIELLHPFYA